MPPKINIASLSATFSHVSLSVMISDYVKFTKNDVIQNGRHNLQIFHGTSNFSNTEVFNMYGASWILAPLFTRP